MMTNVYVSQKDIEQILSVRIEKVLAYYGIRFSGKKERELVYCPFHRESHPSFLINYDKNFAYCFGCGKHWDAIQFIRDKEGCKFYPALKKLCEIAGLGLSEESLRQVHKALLKPEKRQKESNGVRDYNEFARILVKDFIDFYQGLPAWRDFFTTYIEHLFVEYDQITMGKLTREKIDQLKNWFFTSKNFLKNNHQQWKKLPLLRREIHSERVDEDLGIRGKFRRKLE